MFTTLTASRTRRAAATGSSCSQIRTLVHPASASFRSVLWSRRLLASTFSAQKRALVDETV